MPDGLELISSRANARVKQLRGALAGYARLSNGLIGIEGEHLLDEAIRSGIVLKSIFLSEHRPVPPSITRLKGRVEILRLTEEVFSSISENQSPQGIAALLVPPVHKLSSVLWGIPLILVAAGLQDPGNLGTLIRSAEAFGATGVLTTPGTVNAWNGKCLRASVGSLFRTPVVPSTLEDLLALKHQGIRLLAAVGDGVGSESVSELHAVDLSTPVALLIGNEGAGLAPELLALADDRLTIPSAGTVESLNAAVAGSLILYEAFRQRSLVGLPTSSRTPA